MAGRLRTNRGHLVTNHCNAIVVIEEINSVFVALQCLIYTGIDTFIPQVLSNIFFK